MIERDFINQKTKEFYIKKYVEDRLRGIGISKIKLKKIPLGEKIIIDTNRPSLIVGSKGSNIKELTQHLKKEFKLENPQIEINEVKNIFLDANIVAQRIASSLERFGSARFKGIGHKVMENVLNSGALGVEIILSGKIPGARAKNWRFYQGYLKKCGDVALSGVRKAQKAALLKSGIIGIKVAIMPSDIVLPDHIEILDEPIQIVEEIEEPKKVKKVAKKKTVKKKAAPKKKVVKKEEKKVVEPKVEEKPVEEKAEEKVEEKPAESEKKEEPVKEEKFVEEKVEEKVEETSNEKTETENKTSEEAEADKE